MMISVGSPDVVSGAIPGLLILGYNMKIRNPEIEIRVQPEVQKIKAAKT